MSEAAAGGEREERQHSERGEEEDVRTERKQNSAVGGLIE